MARSDCTLNKMETQYGISELDSAPKIVSAFPQIQRSGVQSWLRVLNNKRPGLDQSRPLRSVPSRSSSMAESAPPGLSTRSGLRRWSIWRGSIWRGSIGWLWGVLRLRIISRWGDGANPLVVRLLERRRRSRRSHDDRRPRGGRHGHNLLPRLYRHPGIAPHRQAPTDPSNEPLE